MSEEQTKWTTQYLGHIPTKVTVVKRGARNYIVDTVNFRKFHVPADVLFNSEDDAYDSVIKSCEKELKIWKKYKASAKVEQK